jgi:hypothetical protein
MNMSNLKMFCLTMKPEHVEFITKLSYDPVGLGKLHFPKSCMNDKSDKNIHEKNPYYGEYTFHYWIWKNYLDQINHKWIGFCQYRKYWTTTKIVSSDVSFDFFKNSLLTEIKFDDEEYDCILGEPFFINQLRLSKFIKKIPKKLILNPSIIFDKKKRNIKFHFDMWHGKGNLDKAIDLLEKNDREDFKYFVNHNVSFNPHNMFICKSTSLLKKYYESIFPWLERCEKIFGFENLSGYGLKRIYGFLAERYMSYWFQKNTKFLSLPIYFKDISDYKL